MKYINTFSELHEGTLNDYIKNWRRIVRRRDSDDIVDVDMLIRKWKYKLNLDDWTINTQSIDDNQVIYPDDIEPHEEFFVGIDYDLNTKTGLISHGVELIEEDIVHELLHVANPYKSEEWVRKQTDVLLKKEIQTNLKIIKHI